MANLEDKPEQELSKIKLGTMIHYSLLWTHFVGICIVLGMGAYGLKQYKLLNPPRISAKVLSYEVNNEKEDPYFPVFEYEYAGKKYKKISDEGYWSEVFEVGSIVELEYIEGLPETATNRKLNPQASEKLDDAIVVFCIGLVLFIFPFFMRIFLKWNAKVRSF